MSATTPRGLPPLCATCARDVVAGGVFAGGRWFCSQEHLDRFIAMTKRAAPAGRRDQPNGEHD